jgi:hydrogenase expression/formation protein HypE
MGKSSGKLSLLPPGKLPHDLLKKILSALPAKNPDVILGPQVGIDAAVINLSGRNLAVTSDPITLAGDLAAYYCVHVNANDLAVMGAIPKFMTVVGLFPPSPLETIKRISRDLAACAGQLGITLIGGHTEITLAVNTPIICACLFGPLAGKRIISSANARPGDVVIMTKSAALEASAIIAREKTSFLKKKGFTSRQIGKIKNFLFKPGISILPEAKLALTAGCSAMHDATEGGILTALWEISEAAGVRVEIDPEKIPVLPETVNVCRLWKINPLRAISSGALLVTIPSKKAGKLLTALKKITIEATVIGTVRKGPPTLADPATGRNFGPSEDEIVKIYR